MLRRRDAAVVRRRDGNRVRMDETGREKREDWGWVSILRFFSP
jgi:hypothetical protein